MRRSFRSPLSAMLQEASATCREAEFTGGPLREISAMRAERAALVRRRTVLAGAAGLATAIALPGRSSSIGQPRVVIVGAGAAGLTCAYRLWRERGIAARLYEWNSRVGGRIQTLRDYFVDSELAEQHGEFISSEHTETMRLALRFGLQFENTYADPRHVRDTYWFAGSRYTQTDLNLDWHDFGWKLFRDAVRKAPGANYRHASPTAYEWDHISVSEWIDRYVPGGLNSAFGQLCYSDVIDEYGCPPEHQSALNLVFLLGYDASAANGYQPQSHPVLGGSDEKWHIHGGNDQLTTSLAARLPDGSIHLRHRLVALVENSDGSLTCTFSRDGSTVETVADHVALALPFTTLREVDLSGVRLSPLKRKAIESLPLGYNAKIQIQVAGRPWVKDGFDGTMLTGSPLDGGWDGTSYQNGGRRSSAEVFVCLPGGMDGKSFAARYNLAFGHEQGPAPPAMVSDALAQLEPIFPGVTAAWAKGPQRAWYNDGNIDKHLRGAWSQYNIGQYTGFGGVEKRREGNIHFAGEQTSPEFQGYIEGAVRSGLRAAREI
ncbi:MAG TPA: NAD(P)/FAD-dependent oxidoreductase [Rhizomicrobium sp.]|nr:NAD(P)/FAD-dependent oxidoreductase [Rhizomicrobium sp.]